MSRSCWRCYEPIDADAARCPACGARIIPVDSESASPGSVAQMIRIGALLSAVTLGALIAFMVT